MSAALLAPPYKRRFIVILFLVCLFNLADRAVFSVVVPAMRVELHFSDFQLGILTGFSFALLYGGLGIPIGRLAEYRSRVGIIAAATGLWSLATMLSGAATSFVQMMLARVAVGMGEAGFSAPVASLVGDHFEPRRRASAMAVIWLGLPVGTLIGAIGGGMVAEAYGWRMAFVALGVPGLLVAVIARLALREPPRGLIDAGAGNAGAVPPFPAVLRHIVAVRSLRHIMVAGGVSAIGIQGVAQFMPLLFTRLFLMPMGKAATLFGLVSGGSLAIGLLLGALGTDRASHRDERWSTWGPTVALAAAPVFYLIGFSQQTVPATAALLVCGGVMAMVFYGPALGLVQNLTPASMRASASAVFAMLSALVGTGLGPTLVGFASDRFAALAFSGGRYAQLCGPGRVLAAPALKAACAQASLQGLREAMMLSVLSFGWAAIHFYLASRNLRGDLAAARQAVVLSRPVPG